METKWEAIATIVAVLAFFGYLAFEKHQNTQIEIQKYKAVSTGNSAINVSEKEVK